MSAFDPLRTLAQCPFDRSDPSNAHQLRRDRADRERVRDAVTFGAVGRLSQDRQLVPAIVSGEVRTAEQLGRIPIASLQAIGPLWFFGFPTALALLAIGIDRWRHGKLNRMLVGGTLLLLASYIGRLALMGTDAWMGISRWLTSFV